MTNSKLACAQCGGASSAHRRGTKCLCNMAEFYRNSATWVPLRSIAVLLALFFIMSVMEPMRSVAQPTVFFEKHGLDPTGNPIDRLLDVFGSGCVMFVRERTGRPCRVEKELSSFIDTLPHDARGLSEALIALGATCGTDSTQLIPADCVYEKRVQTAYWIVGESTPRGVTRDTFTVHIITVLDDGIWRSRIEFNRTSDTVKQFRWRHSNEQRRRAMASVSVGQVPLPFGQNHNTLIFRDDNGRIFAEMDGGPVDTNGRVILFGSGNDVQAFDAYASGRYPVGVETAQGPSRLYQPGLPESTIFSGSMSEVIDRYNAAQTAADEHGVIVHFRSNKFCRSANIPAKCVLFHYATVRLTP